jgi:hypothetical protein
MNIKKILIIGALLMIAAFATYSLIFFPCLKIYALPNNPKTCQVIGRYFVNNKTVFHAKVSYKPITLCGGGDCSGYAEERDLLVEQFGKVISINSPTESYLNSWIRSKFPYCSDGMTGLNQIILKKILTYDSFGYFWTLKFDNAVYGDCKLNGLILEKKNEKPDLTGLKAVFLSTDIIDCSNDNIRKKMCDRMTIFRGSCSGNSESDLKDACLYAKAIYENNPTLCYELTRNHDDVINCKDRVEGQK